MDPSTAVQKVLNLCTQIGDPMEQQHDFRPEIKQWLTLWKNQANKIGSKMEFVYRNALKSLNCFTDPVYSSKDCMRIKYFGEKLCQRIDEAMRDYCSKESITFVESDVVATCSTQNEKRAKKQKEGRESSQTETNKRKRNYIPKKGSGGYALLIALFLAERDEAREELDKQELIESAQPHAVDSMTKPKQGSHYTAFNSMKTLILNGLVLSHQKRNAFYRLTESGRQLAQKLVSYTEDHHLQSVPISSEPQSDLSESYETQSPNISDRHVLAPGTFEIVLLVDTREQSSGVDHSQRKTAIISELLKRGIQAEMRTLPVGDFVWVVRRKQNAMGSCEHSPDLVLDYLIERKRADDLASSIVDGRFKEQKHRLKKCGVRKPMYLIEGLVRADYSVPYRNLLQAVTNSQVVDGFGVKCTFNYSETISYLSEMTKQLSIRLSNKNIMSCTHQETQDTSLALPDNYYMTFSEYEKGSKKIHNFTITEMLLKHLIQFSGMTVVKAKAVTDQYKTLDDLRTAYENCLTDKHKEKLLATLKYGNMTRSVGPVLSSKVCKYYTYE